MSLPPPSKGVYKRLSLIGNLITLSSGGSCAVRRGFRVHRAAEDSLFLFFRITVLRARALLYVVVRRKGLHDFCCIRFTVSPASNRGMLIVLLTDCMHTRDLFAGGSVGIGHLLIIIVIMDEKLGAAHVPIFCGWGVLC